MRLRAVCKFDPSSRDIDPYRTEVLNAETGERLSHVVSVRFRHTARSLPRLIVEVLSFEVDVEVESSPLRIDFGAPGPSSGG